MINRERTTVERIIKGLVLLNSDLCTSDMLIKKIMLMQKDCTELGYTDVLFKFSSRGRELSLVAYINRLETDLEYNDRIQYELDKEDNRRYTYSQLKKEFDNE